jgi:hypothetical protein
MNNEEWIRAILFESGFAARARVSGEFGPVISFFVPFFFFAFML